MNPLPGFSWQTDAQCLLCNVGLELAQWLGMDPGEVVAQADALIYAADREPNRMRWAEAARLREPYCSRLRMWRADGRLIWCVVYGEPRYQSGRFVGFAGVTFPSDRATEILATASKAASVLSLAVIAVGLSPLAT